MTRSWANAIVGWHYDEPYHFYDMDQDPEDLAGFLDPSSWGQVYFAVLDARESLIGFFAYEVNGDTAVIGLGLRLDLTGQGLGATFLAAGLSFGKQRFEPRHFKLAVATFNRRAIRLYEKAGFQPEKTTWENTNNGRYEFLWMVKPA